MADFDFANVRPDTPAAELDDAHRRLLAALDLH
jgi:hypothetical protein